MKIAENKEILTTILVVIATIIQFHNSVIQQIIVDSKDNVFDKSINVASGASSLAANSANISLQRELIEVCRANHRTDCGTSEFLLNQEVQAREGIRAFALLSYESLEKAVEQHKMITEQNKPSLEFTRKAFYFFMICAVFINLFNINKLKNMKTSEGLYIKILIWVYERQESGFTWGDLKKQFELSDDQEQWVQKIFRSNMPASENLIDHLSYNQEKDAHRFVITAKGISVAVDYLSLQEARISSRRAEKIALVSILIGIIVGITQIIFR